MIHIDWLSLYQDFPSEVLPRLASEIKTTVCALTGEVLSEFVKGYNHSGSFDTSILIKYDGCRLSMSGNPSAWCRRDNLFGVESVQDAVDIYNSILRGLGYPEFFDCEDTYLRAAPFQSSEKYAIRGLRITRVDLTENYASALSAPDMLRYLSSFSYRGQCGYLYPNGLTVDWLGSRAGDNKASKRLYFKYYSKAYDIEKKLNKLLRIQSNLTDNEYNENKLLNEQINYLSKLLLFAIEQNIIRFELELKSDTLTENNLHILRGWNPENMIIMFDKYKRHDKQKLQFNQKIDLYSQLLAAGVKDSDAKQAALLGQSWLDGHDINFKTNPIIKKSNYYKVRKHLLMIGFNIENPINIVNFPCQVQTVMLKPLIIPEWYEMPNRVA